MHGAGGEVTALCCVGVFSASALCIGAVSGEPLRALFVSVFSQYIELWGKGCPGAEMTHIYGTFIGSIK